MIKRVKQIEQDQEQEELDQESQQKLIISKYLYQIWPGNNQFFFKGKIMFGPKIDNLYYLTSVFCLLITNIPYLMVIVPKIKSHYLIILYYLELIIIIVSFLLLTFTDPGIIPQQKILNKIFGTIPFPFGISDETPVDQITDSFYLVKTDNNLKIKFIYCKICKIYKPPKTQHCNDCNNCIEVYDHHCPYVGNCIGKRNYKYFFILISSLLVTGLTQILTIYQFNQKNKDFYLIIVLSSILVFFIIILFLNQFLNQNTTNYDWKINRNTQLTNYLQPQKINWISQDKPLFNPRQKILF